MNAATWELGVRRAAKFIEPFEGFRSHAYRDPVGVWTIGYGETRGVRPGMVWSKRRAARALRKRLRHDFLPALKRAVPNKTHLTANQVAASLSFIYNLGPGILDRSHTFGAALRDGRKRDAWDSMLLYDMAGGHRLPGLTRRRRAERRLALR